MTRILRERDSQRWTSNDKRTRERGNDGNSKMWGRMEEMNEMDRYQPARATPPLTRQRGRGNSEESSVNTIRPV